MQPIITLKTQTEPLNCTSASIAMILDISVEEVTEDFHERYMNTLDTVSQYLLEKGLNTKRHYADERMLEPSRVYLLTVPSLNLKGGQHYLVAETTPDVCWWVYDPNKGRDGREFYTGETLHAYVPDLSVSVEDLLKFRDHYKKTKDQIINKEIL